MSDSKSIPFSDVNEAILAIEPILVELYSNQDKFITLYNELSWLIIAAKLYQDYSSIKTTSNFTDQDFINRISTIYNNVSKIIKISNNINSITSLADKLSSSDTYLASVENKLDSLYADFYIQLNDSKDIMEEQLRITTVNAKTEILKLLDLMMINGGNVSIGEIARQVATSLNLGDYVLRTELLNYHTISVADARYALKADAINSAKDIAKISDLFGITTIGETNNLTSGLPSIDTKFGVIENFTSTNSLGQSVDIQKWTPVEGQYIGVTFQRLVINGTASQWSINSVDISSASITVDTSVVESDETILLLAETNDVSFVYNDTATITITNKTPDIIEVS